MPLEDPVAAYNAESNMEAILLQQFLDAHGVESFVTDDHSLVGLGIFGNLPEIHKPQVWISRADAERVAQLIVEFERLRFERDAEPKANNAMAISVQCEDCGKSSQFAASLDGTVQDCPHCGSYVDVGEIYWPLDEASDAQSDGDHGG